MPPRLWRGKLPKGTGLRHQLLAELSQNTNTKLCL
jgi:hypothetical protein